MHTSYTRTFVIGTYPTIKNPFCKIRAVDIPLSVILNAYTISCNTRSAIQAVQTVLPQHTAPLRLTEINGQGMNLEQRMNERRSYVTDFLLHRTARNMKHVVARLQRTLHYLLLGIYLWRDGTMLLQRQISEEGITSQLCWSLSILWGVAYSGVCREGG